MDTSPYRITVTCTASHVTRPTIITVLRSPAIGEAWSEYTTGSDENASVQIFGSDEGTTGVRKSWTFRCHVCGLSKSVRGNRLDQFCDRLRLAERESIELATLAAML